MPRARATDRIFEDIEGNVVVGIQVAAEWLAGKLRELVGIACPQFAEDNPNWAKKAARKFGLYARNAKAGHSPLGGPPYKETGAGQRSIRAQAMNDGAVVGCDPIVDRLGDYNGNYLLYWNEHGRPWITGWQDRYLAQFMSLVKAAALRPTLYAWTWGKAKR